MFSKGLLKVGIVWYRGKAFADDTIDVAGIQLFGWEALQKIVWEEENAGYQLASLPSIVFSFLYKVV